MEIGSNIYKLRKQQKMTQEQLANGVGVSAPAVSKWECGLTMPDITLLAPLARILHTTIDDLLSFQEVLSNKEVNKMYEQIRDVCKKEGFRRGMDYAGALLKEYPGTDYLKLRIAAGTGMLSFSIDEDYKEEEFEELQKQNEILWLELINSENVEYSLAAIVSLAGYYMADKKFEEAEVLLQKLPRQICSANRLYPNFYLLKEEYDKALEVSENNLLHDLQNILIDIHSLHTIKIKQGDYKCAFKCAEDYETIIKTFGFGMSFPSELWLETYIKIEEFEKAEEYFRSYVDEIIHMSGIGDTFYFKEIDGRIKKNQINELILANYKAILRSPRYEKVRESKIGMEYMEKLAAFDK